MVSSWFYERNKVCFVYLPLKFTNIFRLFRFCFFVFLFEILFGKLNETFFVGLVDLFLDFDLAQFQNRIRFCEFVFSVLFLQPVIVDLQNNVINSFKIGMVKKQNLKRIEIIFVSDNVCVEITEMQKKKMKNC